LRPDLCRNLRFLAFLIPSRTDLSVYRKYRDAVYAAIDEVNKRFAAECGGEPIQVFYTNDREQALAAMEQCDVLPVNSREDGMNHGTLPTGSPPSWRSLRSLAMIKPYQALVTDYDGLRQYSHGCLCSSQQYDWLRQRYPWNCHILSNQAKLQNADRIINNCT